MTRAWLALLFLASACARDVEPITECPGSSLLVDGVCRVRCTTSASCLSSEVCDPALGVCRRDDGPRGALRFDPGELVFEGTRVGAGLSRAVTLINDGADVARLEVTLEGDAGFEVQGPAQPFELPASTTAPLVVNFQPPAEGTFTATLVARGCDGACTARASLRGEARLGGPLVCQPSDVDFGDVRAERPPNTTLRCTNQSPVDVRIEAVESTPDVLVGPSPAGAIGPGAAFELVISPSARQVGSFSGDLRIQPVGALATVVPFRGRVLSSTLRCEPSSVDLGLGGPGDRVETTIECTNDGAIDVDLSSIFITPPVVGLTYTFGSPLPYVIAPRGRISVDLLWQPASSDPVASVLRLVASGGDPVDVKIEGNVPRCVLTPLDGRVFDFGLTATGRQHEAAIAVRNTGEAECTPTFQLGPGSAELTITGAPTRIAPRALAFVELRHHAQSPQLASRLTMTAPEAAAPVTIDITGAAGSPPVYVATDELRWGQIQAGCTVGNQRDLDLINARTQALALSTIEILQYEPSFFTPVRPQASLGAADRFRMPVEARPATPGPVRGRVRIVSGSVVQYVELFASASAAAARVSDSREAAPVGPVDVLFVIDGDLRTSQLLQRVATNIERFVDRLRADGTDHHVGVVHAQPLPTAGNRAHLVGQPTVITAATMNAAATLASRLSTTGIAVGGAPLLEVAREATTAPRRVGGPNAGFLRVDGQLEVVVISARDDDEGSSTDTITRVLDAMRDRVVGRPRAVRISAIAGGEQGCNDQRNAADPSPRAVQAVRATGGVLISACLDDLGPALADLAGSFRSPLPAWFQLSSQAVPGTVLLPATPGAGWALDRQASRVVFDADARAPVGATAIEWRPWCVLPTCGNGQPDPLEMCDDGNPDDGDACLGTCHSATCGDGETRAPLEMCDDGNLDDEDGCTRSCTFTR